MRADVATMAAILGMALVTFAARAGGLWLTSHLTSSPRVAAGLGHAPGAVLAAILAPAILAGGVQAALTGAATVLVGARTRSFPLATLAGVAAAWALRTVA
jgi:uncharacterized membrane protein